ncbi:hypothetical protein AGMMS50239_40820 [Bacteroidia bacterium]|nr:hypothetical protein AGMMS50239_40820 [Bacteroidia bacterium]
MLNRTYQYDVFNKRCMKQLAEELDITETDARAMTDSLFAFIRERMADPEDRKTFRWPEFISIRHTKHQ